MKQKVQIQSEIEEKIDVSKALRDVLEKIILDNNKYLKSINIILTNDEKLLNINKEYLNHNYLTDIITFNYNKDNIADGELHISIDRVRDNANSLNKSFDEELKRVIIHGVLHLVGYDDGTDEEKTIMRKMEDRYLKFVSRET